MVNFQDIPFAEFGNFLGQDADKKAKIFTFMEFGW